MSDTLKNSLKNLMIDGAGLYTYTTKIYDKLAAQKDSLEADINGLSEDIDSLNEGYEGLTTRLDKMDTTLAGKASSTVTINGHALSEQTISLDAEDLGISAASLGLSSVYKFKNSVASYDLLEKITTKEIGDVYNVSSTGMNYAWDGTNWDSLGFDVDLSDYYVKTEVDSALANKQGTITGAATSITDANLTTGRVLVSNSSGKVSTSTTTDTELYYLKGVTSSVQTQLDGKAPTVHGIHLSDISGGSVGQHLVKQSLTGDNALDYAWQDLSVSSALIAEGWGPALNNASTATNENTASTVVKRDASGNFSAGTITANLTGTASEATKATNDGAGNNIINTYATKTNVDSLLADKADKSSLATVATSGSYNDLTNKPTIDSALSTTSTNAVQNKVVDAALKTKANSADVYAKTVTYNKTEVDKLLSAKANTSSLKTVATSGSYNDLTNKPTIPTVDTTLSTTSTNAIQNKAVATALNTKANSSDVYTKTEVDNNLSGYVQGSIAKTTDIETMMTEVRARV